MYCSVYYYYCVYYNAICAVVRTLTLVIGFEKAISDIEISVFYFQDSLLKSVV